MVQGARRLRVLCLHITGGCRGFTGQTLQRALKLLVSTGAQQEKAIKSVTEAAREPKEDFGPRGLVRRKQMPFGHWPDQRWPSWPEQNVGLLKDPKSQWHR